jgi:hypothetical protein
MVRRALLLALLVLAPASRAEPSADEAVVRQLNAEYVRAFLTSDVGKFGQLLGDDFHGVLADGRVIDRAEFLRQAAQRPDAEDLRLAEVSVRTYTDTAVVTALVTYHRQQGAPVRTRYATLWVRSGASWRITWVQWTRVQGP